MWSSGRTPDGIPPRVRNAATTTSITRPIDAISYEYMRVTRDMSKMSVISYGERQDAASS